MIGDNCVFSYGFTNESFNEGGGGRNFQSGHGLKDQRGGAGEGTGSWVPGIPFPLGACNGRLAVLMRQFHEHPPIDAKLI